MVARMSIEATSAATETGDGGVAEGTGRRRPPNTGLWNAVYRNATDERPYGQVTTYELGGWWLRDLFVEDWGCGLGWFRRYVDGPGYRGVDGSWSRFADEIVDLEQYRSQVPGLFMRHVLEHIPTDTQYRREHVFMLER